MGNTGKFVFHLADGLAQGWCILDVQHHATPFGLVRDSLRTNLQRYRKAQQIARCCGLRIIIGQNTVNDGDSPLLEQGCPFKLVERCDVVSQHENTS